VAPESSQVDLYELGEAWWLLSAEDRLQGFKLLDPQDAEDFFFDLAPRDQGDLLLALRPAERRLWYRLLPPDDAADVIQTVEDPEQHAQLLALLDEATRREVTALLAYAEDEAGGLMSSRFARLRPDMTADEAISYLRKQALGPIEPETIYYVYVLDTEQHLMGVVSFRELFSAPGHTRVRELMSTDVVSAHEAMDQEEVARLFAEHDMLALPVLDAEGRIRGIVTVDDIVDVVEEEATEDIQKYGAIEALEEPYLRTSLLTLVRKRAGWLSILLVGQMVTVSVIGRFQEDIATVAVLALFIPMIISSGGNSGAQSSTLVIRAMAVGEIRMRDWWRVARREVATGLALGVLLGVLGLARVLGGQLLGIDENVAYAMDLGLTIGFSVLGVVLFGTLAGSMLPFALERLGLDPASASAPLVATLMDVTGLLIYFGLASVLLTVLA